jgi:hypothetical protein
MANVTFMTILRMRVRGVIKPHQVHWYENLFTGERYQFALSFNEVRDRPIFPMYAEHRDRCRSPRRCPRRAWSFHFTEA